MEFILFWLIGSFIGFIFMLKLIKVILSTSDFSCGDIVFCAIMSLIGGPVTIGSVGLIWVIEKLPRMSTSSGWCKKLTALSTNIFKEF